MNSVLTGRDSLNFRDIGGIPAAEGRRIRKGLFYRSAGLNWFHHEELEAFQQLGIKYVLDLRTKEEAQKAPDPAISGVEYIRHSGVVSRGGEEIDFSPKGMTKTGGSGKSQYEALMHYYEEMPFGNEAFHILLKEIDKGHVPICFHCATGKDRTGVAAMVLELLLGVKEEDILRDYMMSNAERKDDIEKIISDNPEQMKDEYGRKLLMMRAGVLEETGRNVLRVIRNRCGSYENYLWLEYGYDHEKIRRFRGRFTENM